jgi:hypothetical protein
VVNRSFSNYLPVWTINRNAFFPVPSTYAPGNYDLYGRTGVHPGSVWAEDSFPWTKSGVSDGSAFQPFVPDGVPNPFETIDKGFEPVVADFALVGAYPNPFNPTTTINFTLANAGVAELTVYDIAGRQVANLVDGYRNAGSHEVTFDAAGLASGIYIYRLTTNGQTATAKMTLVK